MRASYSLRAHLVAFAIATLLPVTLLAGVLLTRSAMLERSQLETRLVQVASDLADDIDRDLDRDFTVLQTLAALPSLASEDWPSFYAQAKAAVEGKAYVIVIDPTLRQLVNTLLPYGEAPAVTGDPDTARRILHSKQPAVSDLFFSLIDRKPVFNVNLPIIRDGAVRHILIFGQRADDLRKVLTGKHLGPDWIMTLLDRKGVVLARSKSHEKLVGTTHPTFAAAVTTPDSVVRRAASPEGDPVLRVIVPSELSGWVAVANLPVAVAEAPLWRSLWLWGILTALAFILSAVLAWFFSRSMARPMAAAAEAASALTREQPIAPLRSYLSEANAIVAAQRQAQTELSERAEHQRLLLNELSHRVKNVLAVVQSLIMRTLDDNRPMEEARNVLSDRLLALSRAHEVLMRSDWKGAPIRDIFAPEVAPFGTRIAIEGPLLVIDGRMVQTLALIVHELATNAAKHGALSDTKGNVAVKWSVEGNGAHGRFKFTWQEKDGPRVKPPVRKGFGSSLLVAALADPDITPRLAFEPAGFVYEIDAPLSSLQSGKA
jgi:two-component sensor histidine kinase